MKEVRLQRLKVIYGIALALIALTMLSSFLVMQHAIQHNTSDSRRINLSGRQRMLSQRLTKCVLALNGTAEGEARRNWLNEISDSLEAWNEAHLGLQHGDEQVGLLARRNSREVAALFAEMDPFYVAMAHSLRDLLVQVKEGALDPGSIPATVEVMLRNEPRFLELMDKTTFLFDKEAKERIEWMRILEWIILAAGLLVLLMEFLLVFRPSISQLIRMMTSLERQALELERLNRLKNNFVSTVAHELRNPLSVLREAAAIILEGLAGPVVEEQKPYLAMVKQTSERLIHVTTDLLDLAKIEAGKIVLNFEKMDLLSLVRQSCEGIALRARNKGLTVSEDFPPEERVEISGDFDKLSQVMINLLSNAFKFTEKGSITVEVRDLGEEVRCAVKDTGRGISRENLSRLFSKFEQFGKSTAPTEKGSGLGLVISQSIIEAHGGRMGVESEPDKGSTFFFTLPKNQKQKLGEILLEKMIPMPEQLVEVPREMRRPKP
ncbi:MAG: ATP-binding protein [Candidatus Omnitrophota bacterium]